MLETIEGLMDKYLPVDDIYLFNIGEAQKAYLAFGCHYIPEIDMHRFIVWAPNARYVSVVGDFNGWDAGKNPMIKHRTGVWVTFISGLKDGDNYKYHVSKYGGSVQLKADPFATHAETAPGTASKVWDISGYQWGDGDYISGRVNKDIFHSPMSVYEVAIGSWRVRDGVKFPWYREVADELAEYCSEMGYTHIELTPVTEYPYDESWGYQVTGYYAPTSRYGTPQDFMYFVDTMHRAGIGVLMDWVPAHFPKDEQGLIEFDGTALFEHDNPLRAEHPHWGTLVFNYGRAEVVSFLISSAMMFFDNYHIDGIRVDAVSSMLYLNYGRSDVDSMRNEMGGFIDLHAVHFLKKLNTVVLSSHPGCMTIAEESTAYPLITKPPYDGGLGFSFKWNMGFMNDTLSYMQMDHFFRQYNHNKITFSMHYAFSENYILEYSHDEVVHGKHSMVDKMFGDYWQKFASLRVLYAFQYAHPGKKLNFMGSEFAQFIEWDPHKQLDWLLLKYPKHEEMQRYVRDLNRFYRTCPAMYERDDSWDGFMWLNVDDNAHSSVAFLRIAGDGAKEMRRIVCAMNFTPIVYYDFAVGLPEPGVLREVLNSDEYKYGGSGVANAANIVSTEEPSGDFMHSARIVVPPLGAVFFEYIPDEN